MDKGIGKMDRMEGIRMGWRQEQLKEIMLGQGVMSTVELATDTALLTIGTGNESEQDAINYLEGRDIVARKAPMTGLERKHKWWYTDTELALARLAERGIVKKVAKGAWTWE